MTRKTVLALVAVALAVGLVTAADKANVTITEWDTPTKDSHPHDPLAAADGSLWYTAQYANKLGRLDLKTVKFRSGRSRRQTPGRMVLPKTRTATSGSQRIRKATLVS
jgi:streptogramin lyase